MQLKISHTPFKLLRSRIYFPCFTLVTLTAVPSYNRDWVNRISWQISFKEFKVLSFKFSWCLVWSTFTPVQRYSLRPKSFCAVVYSDQRQVIGFDTESIWVFIGVCQSRCEMVKTQMKGKAPVWADKVESWEGGKALAPVCVSVSCVCACIKKVHTEIVGA